MQHHYASHPETIKLIRMSPLLISLTPNRTRKISTFSTTHVKSMRRLSRPMLTKKLLINQMPNTPMTLVSTHQLQMLRTVTCNRNLIIQHKLRSFLTISIVSLRWDINRVRDQLSTEAVIGALSHLNNSKITTAIICRTTLPSSTLPSSILTQIMLRIIMALRLATPLTRTLLMEEVTLFHIDLNVKIV